MELKNNLWFNQTYTNLTNKQHGRKLLNILIPYKLVKENRNNLLVEFVL